MGCCHEGLGLACQSSRIDGTEVDTLSVFILKGERFLGEQNAVFKQDLIVDAPVKGLLVDIRPGYNRAIHLLSTKWARIPKHRSQWHSPANRHRNCFLKHSSDGKSIA